MKPGGTWVLVLDSPEPLFTTDAPFVKLALTTTIRALARTRKKEQGILKQHPKTSNLESKKTKEGNQSSHGAFWVQHGTRWGEEQVIKARSRLQTGPVTCQVVPHLCCCPCLACHAMAWESTPLGSNSSLSSQLLPDSVNNSPSQWTLLELRLHLCEHLTVYLPHKIGSNRRARNRLGLFTSLFLRPSTGPGTKQVFSTHVCTQPNDEWPTRECIHHSSPEKQTSRKDR